MCRSSWTFSRGSESFAQRTKGTGVVVRKNGSAILPGKDEVFVSPVGDSPSQSLGRLEATQRAEYPDGVRIDADISALVVLRSDVDTLLTHLSNRTLDMHEGSLQVDIGPSEGQELTASHSGRCSERPQRGPPVPLVQPFQEAAKLFALPGDVLRLGHLGSLGADHRVDLKDPVYDRNLHRTAEDCSGELHRARRERSTVLSAMFVEVLERPAPSQTSAESRAQPLRVERGSWRSGLTSDSTISGAAQSA